jgi:FKBP-type peptidyl-prolyl cis-trans isomerase
MKILSITLLAFLMLLNTTQAQEDKKAKKKAIQDFSYAYGYRFAKSLSEKENFDASEKDTKYLLKGIKAGLKPDSATLTKLGESISERIEDEAYKVTKENAKDMAYNLGYLAVGNVIENFEVPRSDFHYGSLKKGLTAFNKGQTPPMSDEKMEEVIATYFKKLQEALEEKERIRLEKEAIENKEKSAAFLADNAKKEGIKTTASGLQYQVLKEGNGEQATIESTVKVHYHGTTIDGKVFDSSVDKDQPATFPLKNLIQGWQEGIPMMKVGAKYKFFIPANLAYGEDANPSIGPNQALIFEIELLEIKANILKTDKDRLSYSYGYVIAQSLGQANLTPEEKNTGAFIEGWAKGFEGGKAQMEASDAVIKARFQSGMPSPDKAAALKLMYSIGFSSSASMVELLTVKLADFDLKLVSKGFDDALENAEALLTKEQVNQALQQYFEPKQQAATAQKEEKEGGAGKENVIAGQKFLAENAKKEGVVTLPSGLQYMVLQEGTGEKPTINDKVTTHYHGTLIDGSIFDSSVERGSPATFPVGGVIQGWVEGLQLMKKGAKYRFFIPHNLAYGMRAMGPKIPAGSTLIFDVELLEITK